MKDFDYTKVITKMPKILSQQSVIYGSIVHSISCNKNNNTKIVNIPMVTTMTDPNDISSAEVQAEIASAAEPIFTSNPYAELSPKAQDFMLFINTAGKEALGGAIQNKLKILSAATFLKILPLLASTKMLDTLAIEKATDSLDIKTQGMLEFASTIGVDSEYIDKVYGKYLKSFLR